MMKMCGSAQLDGCTDDELVGLILWGTKNIYKVVVCERGQASLREDAEIVECRLKGKRGISDTDAIDSEKTFLLAGDWVKFQKTGDGIGYITERLDRQNCLMRKKQDVLHAIVVNIDILLVVSSVQQPPFRPRFIDRMLYSAQCENIPVIILINKIDLHTSYKMGGNIHDIDENLQKRIEVYKSLGVEVLCISVTQNYGIDELQDHLQDKVVGVVGQSGVGKSSLINILIPNAQRVTGDISEKYDRGRHTTIRPEFLLGTRYHVVDTPGIRELYPHDMDAGSLRAGFPDIFAYSSHCKLPDCSHRYEPQCAVQEQVGKNIHTDRYESYRILRNTLDEYEQNKWNRRKR